MKGKRGRIKKNEKCMGKERSQPEKKIQEHTKREKNSSWLTEGKRIKNRGHKKILARREREIEEIEERKEMKTLRDKGETGRERKLKEIDDRYPEARWDLHRIPRHQGKDCVGTQEQRHAPLRPKCITQSQNPTLAQKAGRRMFSDSRVLANSR